MSRIIPLQQGNLDGLCGVYSVVNATRKVNGGLNSDQSKELFMKIISHLKDKKQGLNFLIDGISIHDIGRILRDIIEPDYGIIRSKPYHQNPLLDLRSLWDYMSNYFLQNSQRAIIIGLGGRYDHWTVVDSITDKRITLLDSDNLLYINRNNCTTTDRITKKRGHRLLPTHAYFLEK